MRGKSHRCLGKYLVQHYMSDTPDIDGRVWIASDEPVHEGDFVMVKIDGCTDGDLCGYVVEEEA